MFVWLWFEEFSSLFQFIEHFLIRNYFFKELLLHLFLIRRAITVNVNQSQIFRLIKYEADYLLENISENTSVIVSFKLGQNFL